jgi:hypothetical protein
LVQRRRLDRGFHLFLRNAQFAGADNDDRAVVRSDFFELLTIVMIDRPFSGAIKVEPRALADVLADFKPSEPPSSRPGEAR